MDIAAAEEVWTVLMRNMNIDVSCIHPWGPSQVHMEERCRAHVYQQHEGQIHFMNHDCQSMELVPTGTKKFMVFKAISVLLSPGALENLAQGDMNFVGALQN